MSTSIATITSKRQLTIPVEMYRKLNLSRGDKVIVESTNDGLMIKKAKGLVKELSGSIVIPEKTRGVSLDKAISEAKKRRFSST